MKKLYLILIAFGFFQQATIAQTFEFVSQMGGDTLDISTSICVDSLGNIYSVGYFEGTSDFDPGIGTYNLTSNGWKDIYVTKMDMYGDLIWAKQIGGSFSDYGNSISVDANGNVYTTGSFFSTVDFDPGPETYNLTAAPIGCDIFILKLNTNGDFEWAIQIEQRNAGLDKFNHGRSIEVDGSGFIYTSGDFNGVADFDPGEESYLLTAEGWNNIYILKLDNEGAFIWAKHLSGPTFYAIVSTSVDDFGNVYTVGSFEQTADFDPSEEKYELTSFGYQDIFVSKLDPAGNFLWAKQLGGVSNEYGYSFGLDQYGNIYATGSFIETADFDPSDEIFELNSYGSTDVFISKLNSSGDFVWAKQIGGSSKESGSSIGLDQYGNVYTTGYFKETADFDPGEESFELISGGGSDIFISKLDSMGVFVWTKQMGGIVNDYGECINVDASGNVYTTGVFQETVDFDPSLDVHNLTSFGDFDVFIHKMNQMPVGKGEVEEDNRRIVIFPNPSKSIFTIISEPNVYFKVFDLNGNVNFEGKIIENTTTFDFSHFNKGIYILNVENKYYKLIKN